MARASSTSSTTAASRCPRTPPSAWPSADSASQRRAAAARGLRAARLDGPARRHPRRPVLPDWRDPADGDPRRCESPRPPVAGGRGARRPHHRRRRGSGSGAGQGGTGQGRLRRHRRPRRRPSRRASSSASRTAGPPGPVPADRASPTSSAARPASRSRSARSPTTCPGPTPSPPTRCCRWPARSPTCPAPRSPPTWSKAPSRFAVRHGHRRYFLDYQAAYGNAPIRHGQDPGRRARARVPPRDPVAVPDSVTLFGQAASLVDVLANDVDPSGGLLVGAARRGAGRQPARRRGRRRPLAAGRPPDRASSTPNPQVVRYTISNGTAPASRARSWSASARRPADDTPVTENDRVTVRAGSSPGDPGARQRLQPVGRSADPRRATWRRARRPPRRPSPRGDPPATPGRRSSPAARSATSRPSGLDGSETFTIRYHATNDAGRARPPARPGSPSCPVPAATTTTRRSRRRSRAARCRATPQAAAARATASTPTATR